MLAADGLTLAGRLEDASAVFAPGTLTAICGPNGAGKSTLLASLAGLLVPQAGAVSLDGRPLDAMPPRERAQLIGFLPQVGETAWDLSVRTLAGLGRLPHGTGPQADRVAVDAALAALDLGGLAERPLSTLSGGERARALLARVLAGEPQVVLADEPLAALDLAHQAALLAHFRVLAQGGRTVVLVLHDLAAALNHADRVLVVDKGRIVAAGPPAEALAEAVVARVWGIAGQWHGPLGHRAFGW